MPPITKPAPVRKVGEFVEAPKPVKRAVCIVYGPTGQGKTTFALSSIWPGQKGAYIDTERRGLWAIDARQARIGEKILYLPLDYLRKGSGKTDAAIMAEASKVWDTYMRNYEDALKASIDGRGVQTVIVDTASELYKTTLFFKIFGRTDKVLQRDHGIPRSEFRAMTRMAREYPVNLILICHEKEEYLNNTPTGRMTWAGFEEMGADVDFSVRARIVQNKRPKEGESAVSYELSVEKALEGDTLGQVYTNADWEPFGPFVYTCMQQFVGTGPEDWGWREDEDE